jgi:hypothetical protein
MRCANPAQITSVRGTNRTLCDVCSESAFRGIAEVELSGRQVSFCGHQPNQSGRNLGPML